jgi:DNA-binding Lrp family transcriptional regulator
MLMDHVDRKILAELQKDGRQTITELSEKVRLSLSRCQRRLRELENAGVIRGYRAVLDPEALGLGFEVLVFVTLHKEDRSTLAAFDEAVAAIPNVLHAQRLFGDPDCLLRIVAADLADYRKMYEEQLTSLPGVQTLTSTIVMKQIVDARPLPT